MEATLKLMMLAVFACASSLFLIGMFNAPWPANFIGGLAFFVLLVQAFCFFIRLR